MRGLISNEAGCGTAPAAHAVSSCESPCAQGVFGIAEVVVDTLILCTMTALVVIVAWEENPFIGENFIMMTVGAYEAVLGKVAAYFMSISVLCFAFATVVCLAHYGRESVGYLSKRPFAQKIFTTVYCAFVFVGAFCAPLMAWEYADLAIGVMTAINVPVLFLCRKEIDTETKSFFEKRK
jgi:AGCS family alanine or glycine:cation symporter